jgi:hypothetical protein
MTMPPAFRLLVPLTVFACLATPIRATALPRAYPARIPADVSFQTVVAAEPYPAMKLPVPIVGWKNHPEEIHVTPNGALVFPRADETHGLYLAPLVQEGDAEPRLLPLDGADRALVDGYKPGILSAWSAGGVTVKQEVFGTLLHGEEVRTGREPLLGLCRWTLTNPTRTHKTVSLWLNFGAAVPGMPMDAPPPAYGRRLSFDTPAVSEPDGKVAAVLLTPGLDAAFHPLPARSEGDAGRFTVLNGEEKTVEGAAFEVPVRRDGDKITANGWTSPNGADLYFEASRKHSSSTALDVEIVGADGAVTSVGKLFRTGLSRGMRPDGEFMRPGEHSSAVPWSVLKDRIPQGESRIVLTASYPTPDGPKRPSRWEPIAYLAEPGAVPRFAAPGPGNPRENSLRITVTLAPGAAKNIDVAVPYFPLTPDGARDLRRLDFDARLAAFRRYWTHELNKHTRFDIPEKRIRDAYRTALAYNLLLTDTQAGTRRLLFHPDPTAYEFVWAGDGGVIADAMDRLGYHREAERGLDYFLAIQGTRKPDGDVSDFRGFLTGDSPNWWISENGFVLWALAQHYKLTGDAAWLRKAAPAMVESADWIIRQRARTKVLDSGKKPRSYGLLPKGAPSDIGAWDNWYWSDTYSYMGLRGAADVLGAAGKPEEAARLDAEARDYKACILDSLGRSINRDVSPPWVPASPFRNAAPTQASVDAEWYSLSSPIYMVEAGLFPATDPKAAWTLSWLERYGSITGLPSFGPEVVDPHYVYNTALAQLLRGETKKFLWTFYSMFAWGQSRSTYATVETINIARGINGPGWDANRQPHMHSNSRVLDMVRIALLLEDGPRLHLMAGTPTGWLAPGKTIGIHGAPTEFGNVDLIARSVAGKREIRFEIFPPARRTADLVLHVRPPDRYGTIRSVTVNGKPWRNFTEREIRLGKRTGTTHVVCGF